MDKISTTSVTRSFDEVTHDLCTNDLLTNTKEKPILMDAESVSAILDGKKTQTRRIMKPQPEFVRGQWRWNPKKGVTLTWLEGIVHPRLIALCPYGTPGHRLWVRETWAHENDNWGECEDAPNCGLLSHIICRETFVRCGNVDSVTAKWRPSIHMPRWASRIDLVITGVCIERVQRISVSGIQAEGISPRPPDHLVHTNDAYAYYTAWKRRWDSLNIKRGFGWDVNPWCWCVSFERLQGYA